MSLTKKNRNYDIWGKSNILFVISLIIISLGILLLIIGYDIYSVFQSLNQFLQIMN